MQSGKMDKSIFFITLSCICIWLIVDQAVGKQHLSNFLATLFPFMGAATTSAATGSTSSTSGKGVTGGTGNSVNSTTNNAPSSAAAGQNKDTNAAVNSVPYGATRGIK